MHGSIFFWGFVVMALFVVGSICGVIALGKIHRLVKDLQNLRNQLSALEHDLRKQATNLPIAEEEIAPPPWTPPPESVEKWAAAPAEKAAEGSDFPPPPSAKEEILSPPPSPPLPPRSPSQSLEMKLGTKWLNWVGIVMLLVGVGFFLKYAYDNAWIGPKGRLAIGAILGLPDERD